MTERPFHIPPFATQCIEAAAAAWQASFEHPFVTSLAAGTLDKDRFRFYQIQDARYLEAFSDACCLLSARCPLPADKLWFIDAARMALVVESELHLNYGKQLGYTADDIRRVTVTPNNHAYQNHMIAAAGQSTLVEAVAALTPCPWLYIDLGGHFLKQLGEIADSHPYADWLRMYSDPALHEYMDNILERLQRYADAADAATRDRAIQAFVQSAHYEWMFWQQAWVQQKWPASV